MVSPLSHRLLEEMLHPAAVPDQVRKEAQLAFHIHLWRQHHVLKEMPAAHLVVRHQTHLVEAAGVFDGIQEGPVEGEDVCSSDARCPGGGPHHGQSP